jgi:hypothetical protein
MKKILALAVVGLIAAAGARRVSPLLFFKLIIFAISIKIFDI